MTDDKEKKSVAFLTYIKKKFPFWEKRVTDNNETDLSKWLSNNLNPDELKRVLIVEKAASSNFKLGRSGTRFLIP